MKVSTRLLITATTLAALTMLGPAATAAARVPTPPGGQQHPTTVEPGTGPQPGHGAQLHHDAHDTGRATAGQPATDPTTNGNSAVTPWITALAATLVGLFVGLAGAIWLGRRHRPSAAV